MSLFPAAFPVDLFPTLSRLPGGGRRYGHLLNRPVLLLLVGLFSICSVVSSEAQPAAPAPTKSPADGGRALRQMMLTTPPEKIGVKPTREFPRVYGILMDWPVGEETTTIFSSSSGAASLYTTSAFGIIGGEGQEAVRTAAVKFVRAADRLVNIAKPTTEYPYPAADRVRFYLLTFKGVRVLETDLASIESGTNEYLELFSLGQFVLAELRLATKKRE